MVKSNNVETRAVTEEEHADAEAFAYGILSMMNQRKVDAVPAMTGLAIASVQFCLNTDDPAAALRDLQSVQNQHMVAMQKSIAANSTTRSYPGRRGNH